MSPNSIESNLFAAELGEVPELDLHGWTPEQARHQIEYFIHTNFVQGEKVCRIIHGRGEGMLRTVVQTVLREGKSQGLVSEFRDSTIPMSLGGVTVVALSLKK